MKKKIEQGVHFESVKVDISLITRIKPTYGLAYSIILLLSIQRRKEGDTEHSWKKAGVTNILKSGIVSSKEPFM